MNKHMEDNPRLYKEVLERLNDRFSTVELVEYLDLTVSQVADSFYDDIVDNDELMEEIGLKLEDDDD